MAYIQAGSVEKFLPLFFTTNVTNEVCSGRFEGGGSYAPPALLADVMVCKNNGNVSIVIDDFFGASDKSQRLRAYDPSTPSGSQPLDWGRIELNPGESVFVMQRLLFTSQPVLNVFNKRGWSEDQDNLPNLSSQRAVFGQADLPKGVIVNGEEFPFDGRSHNSLLVASYSESACCPYLYSWCEIAGEWVSNGKVMVNHIGIANKAEDIRRYSGLWSSFRLVEHEHERTFLLGITRVLTLRDGTTVEHQHLEGERVLDIGQSHEVTFDLPTNLTPEDITWTSLKVNGYYEKYTAHHFQVSANRLSAAL